MFENHGITHLWSLDVPADGTGGVLPLGQAQRVELVVAQNRQNYKRSGFKKNRRNRDFRQFVFNGGFININRNLTRGSYFKNVLNQKERCILNMFYPVYDTIFPFS